MLPVDSHSGQLNDRKVVISRSNCSLDSHTSQNSICHLDQQHSSSGEVGGTVNTTNPADLHLYEANSSNHSIVYDSVDSVSVSVSVDANFVHNSNIDSISGDIYRNNENKSMTNDVDSCLDKSDEDLLDSNYKQFYDLDDDRGGGEGADHQTETHNQQRSVDAQMKMKTKTHSTDLNSNSVPEDYLKHRSKNVHQEQEHEQDQLETYNKHKNKCSSQNADAVEGYTDLNDYNHSHTNINSLQDLENV